jgi:hypothetical protein
VRVLPDALIGFLIQLPIDSVVLLRSPNLSEPGRFEQMVSIASTELWLRVEWVRPDLSDPDETGRNWIRDVEMVGRCDCVLAFFRGDEMGGGTYHVVEKAMDQRVPVYSYGVVGGRFVRIGEHDPDDMWGRLAPRVP